MSDDDPGYGGFEERIRSIARELSRSVERIAELDAEAIAETIGVDPARAREFADAAGRWLSGQAEHLGRFGKRCRGAPRPTTRCAPRDRIRWMSRPKNRDSRSAPWTPAAGRSSRVAM
jgi:hypothetical protein